MDIEILAPASADLWFEALSVGAPCADEIGRVAALLKTGPLRPHLRMVVTKRGKSFGRLAARVNEGCIRIWNPDFREGTAPDEMHDAMRRMIGRIGTARIEAGLTHLAIENRPGDDLKHNDLWLHALRQEGYAETCAYRIYALSLDRIAGAGPIPQGLTIHDIDHTGESILVGLYRSVKSKTLQQRDIDCERPERMIYDMRKVGRGHDAALWLLARLEGEPVGYALANLAEEAGFHGLSAWLVDIGCIPEQRRKHIASALLDEITQRLRLVGALRLLAATDDINVPSIRLQLSHGFVALPDRHYVYRLGE